MDSNTIRPTTTASGDVYIIPDYNNRNHGPAQILVLPFVPHPSASTSNSSNLPPPPPHYFYTGRSATPSYHDPPPDYETLTHSCSCSTQLTSVADDYGKECQWLLCVWDHFLALTKSEHSKGQNLILENDSLYLGHCRYGHLIQSRRVLIFDPNTLQ